MEKALVAAGGGGIHDVDKWLMNQRVYTLHKAARKRYTTRPYKTSGPQMLWQADLVEMIPYANENDDIRYMLTVIDVFSRYAWARPLKRKTGERVKQAFNDILLQDGNLPANLQTDQGKEFENEIFQRYLRDNRVNFFTIKSQFKAALVERFNRTLKEKMWRYFTHVGNYRWIDVLQDFVRAYNNAPHRSLNKGRLTPTEASQNRNVGMLRRKQERMEPQSVTRRNPSLLPKLAVGDYVRLSKAKKVFDKGYLPNWTEEVFQVVRIIKKFKPIQYKVQDWSRNVIDGSFYRGELQKVSKPETFMIESIVRQRTRRPRGGRAAVTEYLVKWFGYGPEANTWEVLDKQIVDVVRRRQRQQQQQR